MNPSYNKHSAYMPHIDGLRTIAVCSVFLYHLFPEDIRGGFLGVDIFFVISGYLITNIIKSSIEDNQFSFFSFYLRRIRRLFPAFALVLLMCFLASYHYLDPLSMYEFAISGIYSVASLANIYFLLNSGYFAPAAETQVLLHTWSLSVEEQFYFFWPLLMYFLITRIPGKYQRNIIFGLIFTGILLCYWGTGINKDLAFYITPFRSAEFAIGAILCWVKGKKTNAVADEISVVIALILITLSVLMITDNTVFPGWLVFIPCVGTAIVIYQSDSVKTNNYLLGNSVMAYVGRISYPLYLVHWPLIVFAKLHYGNELLIINKLSIIILAFLMAALIHELLERPLLTSNNVWSDSSKTLKIFLIGLIVLLVIFAQLTIFKGFPGQVPKEIHTVIENASNEKQRRFELVENSCDTTKYWAECKQSNDKDKKTLLILGDSHGPDALNAIGPHYEDVNFLIKTVPGCPPLSSQDFSRLIKTSHPNFNKCKNITSELESKEFFDDVDFLIFSIYFNKWYKPEMLANFLMSVKIPDRIKVILLGNGPSFNQALPEIVSSHKSMNELDAIVAGFINKWTWEYENNLSTLAMKYNFKFISKIESFCNIDAKECKTFIGEDNMLLTYDEHHLSVDAAREFGLSLKEKYPTVDALFGNNPVK